jgi:hypothetical protein
LKLRNKGWGRRTRQKNRRPRAASLQYWPGRAALPVSVMRRNDGNKAREDRNAIAILT